MEPESSLPLRLVKGDTQPVPVVDPTLTDEDFRDFEDFDPADDDFELPLGPGFRIPNTPYRIDEKIGEGGMGDVYLATHVEIDRRVGLKVLALHHCLDRHCVDTFRNEARASARIGAPNIVDIYDIYELRDGRVALCMEFVDGVTLEDVLHDDDMDLPRLLGILRQLCKGLAAAHAAQIVHRDIKPGNIMLSTRGEAPDFVKLLDFGIAAVQNDDAQHPVAGTPEYMAPETFRGEPLTGSVDLYAVGCLLYEWACGRRPFEGDPKSVATAQVWQAPPPVNDFARRKFPPGLVRVIERCLAKQPGDRYADMGELEAALIEVQVEAGCTTPWDHLPLPRVELAHRDRLGQSLTELRLGPKPSARRYWVPAVGLGLVAVAAIVTAVQIANTNRVSEGLMAAAVDVKMTQSFGPAPILDELPTAAAGVVDEAGRPDDRDAGRAEGAADAAAAAGEAVRREAQPDELATAAVTAEAPRPKTQRKSKRQRLREARAREEKRLLAALDQDPTSLDTLDALAAHYFRRRAYRASAKYAQQAVDADPTGRRWLKLGHAEYKLSRWGKAKAAYEKAQALGDPFAGEHIALVDQRLAAQG